KPNRSQRSKANTHCGGENPRRKCYRRSKNSGSVSFHLALSAEVFLRARGTTALRSTVRTYAVRFRVLRRRLAKRIRRWLICSEKSQRARRRHLLRSRSPGCSVKSHGLLQFLSARSEIACRKISERLKANLRRTIFAKSKTPHQRSRSKVPDTRK